MFNVSNV